MLKALIKKEFASFFGKLLFRNKISGKSGKKNPAATIALFVILLLFVYLVLCFAFFGLFVVFATAVLENDSVWFFGAFAALLGTAFSLIGSIFATQTQLYDANDNDLLLSLPIPTPYILISRIIPLYAYNLFFVSAVLVPAFLAYMMFVNFSLSCIVSWVMLIITISFVSLAICCLIGRLTAGLTARFKNNSLMSIALTLVLFVLYIVFVASTESILDSIINELDALTDVFKKYLPTLYWTGLALDGNLIWLVVTFLINAAIVACVFWLLSTSYIKIVTDNKSFGRKNSDKTIAAREKSILSSLLYKEWKRFIGSAVYFINCSIGALFLLVATIALIVNASEFSELVNLFDDVRILIPPVVFVAAAIMTSMNCVSAASISLEGKSLWLIKTLPVKTFDILKAKLILHFLVSAPLATIFIITAGIITSLDALSITLLCIAVIGFVLVCGAMGLRRNIKNPDFDWTNESQPVKQSINVLLCMLVSTGLSFVFFFTILGFSLVLPACLSILVAVLLILGLVVLYYNLLKTKSVSAFENL